MKETLKRFHEKNDQMPLAAVLRGMPPEEALDVADALVENGFTILEITLNNPDPFESIKLIGERYGDKVLLAAGTVMHPDEVAKVKDLGCDLAVSPNFNADVVKETVKQGLVSVSGTQTPTEMFGALNAGADIIKIFPPIDVAYFNAMKSVAPAGTVLWPTGATVENVAGFFGAGATTMGVGPVLYKPGKSAKEVGDYAKALTQAVRDARS